MPDQDGYPTEEELQHIEKFPADGKMRELAEYVVNLWHWDDWAKLEGDKLELHTGGWSGNEMVVMALEKQTLFWAFYWQKSERGGHYHFSGIPL